MRYILFITALFLSVPGQAQKVYATKIAGLNALVYASPGLDTTQPVNLMLFTPGAGQQGTDITQLLLYGPFHFLKTAVDIKAPLLVVAVQNVNTDPRPNEYQSYIDGIKKLYKVNKIVLTGLSRGGQNAEWFANSSEARLAEIAGMVLFSSQGTVTGYSDFTGDFTPSLYLKYNIPVWRGLGDQDFTWGINWKTDSAMRSVAPKLAIWTVWPGAGHGDPVWVQGYDPFPVATNPVFVTMKMSIYQWASGIMGGPASQPATIIYKNAAKSQVFTRNNCTCGSGTTATYTVPAGKYSGTTSQATVDLLATNDIATNGQAYANANGTCTPVLIMTIQVFSDGTIKTVP